MSHLITAKTHVYDFPDMVCCRGLMFNTSEAEASLSESTVQNEDGSWTMTLTKANTGDDLADFEVFFYLCCSGRIKLEVGGENWVAKIGTWDNATDTFDVDQILLLYALGDYDSDETGGSYSETELIPIGPCGLLVQILWSNIAAEVGETIDITFGLGPDPV